ncbi:hypothetical protein [Verrucomicrobium spinosum]|uniref:hypothetical protein n=1 Tax=Verrucomicrobium spinosum TaxID=2736 RepID=UPI0001744C71|nr:hypothetical protein [Verrucomicrobium spinosum]
MKRLIQFLILSVLVLTARAQDLNSNEALVRLVAKLDTLTRVTEQRIELRAIYSDLCAPVDIPDHARVTGRPDVAIHVFITSTSAAAFKDPASRFPVGTVVIKQNFPTVNAKEADFYTGMLKREAGFNPACGDWEFFTMSGDRRAGSATRQAIAELRLEGYLSCQQRLELAVV